MHKFTSSSWYDAPSQGVKIAAVTGDQIPDGMWDPGALVGADVEIDGVGYRVYAVEKFLHYISPESPYTKDFGIAVPLEEKIDVDV